MHSWVRFQLQDKFWYSMSSWLFTWWRQVHPFISCLHVAWIGETHCYEITISIRKLERFSYFKSYDTIMYLPVHWTLLCLSCLWLLFLKSIMVTLYLYWTFCQVKPPGQIVNLIGLKIISNVNVMLPQSTTQHMIH